VAGAQAPRVPTETGEEWAWTSAQQCPEPRVFSSPQSVLWCPPRWEAGGPPFPRKSLPVCIHTDIRSLAKILLCEECVFLCTRGKRVWAGPWARAWPSALLPQLRQPGSLRDCAVPPGLKHRGRGSGRGLCLGRGQQAPSTLSSLGAHFPHRLRDARIPGSVTLPPARTAPRGRWPLPRGGNVGSVAWGGELAPTGLVKTMEGHADSGGRWP